MIRKSLAMLAFASIAGCSASTNFQPFSSNRGEEQSQLAAYAAQTKYPSDIEPVKGIQAAAIISKDSVKVVNFSDLPIRDANLWVNTTFVHREAMIPSHGAVTIDLKQFYDASGQNMSQVNALPHRVEVLIGNKLYSLGTATE